MLFGDGKKRTITGVGKVRRTKSNALEEMYYVDSWTIIYSVSLNSMIKGIR